jgi:phosphate transport system protein
MELNRPIAGEVQPHGSNGHTLRFFDDELNGLKSNVAHLGSLTEVQVRHSVRAILNFEADLATSVVAQNDELHAVKRELEKEIVRIIALRQPLANDLRLTIAAMKMAAILERVGDFASNIAKRAIVLADPSTESGLGRSILDRVSAISNSAKQTIGVSSKELPLAQLNVAVSELGVLVSDRLKHAVDAYAEGSLHPAMNVWEADQEIDDRYCSLISDLLANMIGNPRCVPSCSHLLFVAKNLERIGDYATNIAEIVHYEHVGESVEAIRPKGGDLDAAVSRISALTARTI